MADTAVGADGDPVALEGFQGILQFRFEDRASRWLLEGEAELEPGQKPSVYVAVAGDAGARAARIGGLREDSLAKFELPGVGLDDDELYELEMRFYTGEEFLVLISGSLPLPRQEVRYVAAAAVQAITEANWSTPSDYLELARPMRSLGLDVLRERTSETEASVRQALDDEDFSAIDFDALRRYPERLAKVEAAARSIGENEPTWRSAKPPSAYPNLGPVVVDLFYERPPEVAAEARAAVARLSSLISSQQIVLTQRQARDTARFQRLVTVVGAAVLVPGLVAAVFGANVGFRGRGSTSAFWAMLALMAGGGFFSYGAIRCLEERLPERVIASSPLRHLASPTPAVWVGLTLLVGAALFIVGVFLMLS